MRRVGQVFQFFRQVFEFFVPGRQLDIALGRSGQRLKEPETVRELLLSSLMVNLLALGMPLVILQIYDRVLPHQARDTLAFMILGLLVVLGLDLILKILRSSLSSLQATNYGHAAGLEAMKRIMRAPFGKIESEAVSIHIHRMNDLAAVAEFYAGSARQIAMDLPFILIFLLIMALVGGPLALIPVILFGGFAFSALRRSLVMRSILNERAEKDNRKYDFIIEVLSGIQTVKAFAMEAVMQRRFERLQQAVAEITYQSILIGHRSQSAALMYGNISQLAVVGCGALLVIHGSLSMGSLACCTLLSGQILQPLQRSISLWSEMHTLQGKREEAGHIFRLPAAPDDALLPSPLTGAIAFQDVSFASAHQRARLSHVALKIFPGQIIGLQGEDGSGRSALLHLIRGHMSPSSGCILLDDYCPDGPESSAVQRQIAYVGSSPVLVRGTILDNIAMFRNGVFRLAARDAAALIGLEDEIHALPEGYETRIGEGVTDDLPTSFAQQICIARALAMSPRILLLDEANTVLDRKAETRLIKALEALRGSVTIVIVSHRPSLLAISDQLYELSQGILIPAEKSYSSSGVDSQIAVPS